VSGGRLARRLPWLLAAAWLWSPPARAADPDGLRIIDAHTHTEFPGTPESSSGVMQTSEEYFQEMQEAGVVGAVAHTLTPELGKGPKDSDLRAHNVIHCAGTEGRVDAARLEKGLRSGRYRCIKIYLGYVHQWASDRRYEPAYRLAEKYRVPVVFHTGDTYSEKAKLKYADPLTIDEVAVDHPKVTFVIAHCGNPWLDSAAEVAYKNPNVVLDGSALLIGDLDKMPPEKVDQFLIRPLSRLFAYVENPAKLMFGTDWPLARMAPMVAAFKKAIPKEHWQAVFHDNAARVFRFDPAPGPSVPLRE